MTSQSIFEDNEDEYPEDLILLNYEQNSIYHRNREAEGFENISGTWQFNDDIILNTTLRRLCTSPEIPNGTAAASLIDRSVSVKLIDYVKFPWYFKKYTRQIINQSNSFESISITDSDTDDDCIIIDDPIEKVPNKIKTFPVNNAADCSPNTQLGNQLISKRLESMKRREDIELQKALEQKNKDNIDFKRNKGLVGLTIIRKVSVTDVAPDATIDKAKENTEKTEQINTAEYVNVADKILSSFGTDLIEVIEDLEAPAAAQHKEANDKAKNVVSESDTRKAVDIPNSSSNMSVKSAKDKKTKSHKDVSKNKIDNSAEKVRKHDDKLKKKKTEPLVGKDSSSKLKTKKSKNNVKDSKKTNKYTNDQLKKSEIDVTNKRIDTQQKYVALEQDKSNQNVPKSVPKDDDGTKKDVKKLTCTTEENNKGCGSGSSSPILQCNSGLKRHQTVDEIASKRSNHDLIQNASNKTVTDKTSSKFETPNNESQNIKQSVLKTNQSEDKSTNQSHIAVSNPNDGLNLNKTGQIGSVASPGQTKALNKLHYYSLTYTEPKKKTSVDTQRTGAGEIKNTNINPSSSITQDCAGPRRSLEDCPIHILSVEKINNSDIVFKNNVIPAISDEICRVPNLPSNNQLPAVTKEISKLPPLRPNNQIPSINDKICRLPPLSSNNQLPAVNDEISRLQPLPPNNHIPAVGDETRLSPLSPTSNGLSQVPKDPVNVPSKNQSNITPLHVIPVSIPYKNLKFPKPYLMSNNINNYQAPNYNPVRHQHNPRFGQPIQTQVGPRPSFPQFRGAPPPYRGNTPPRYVNTSFMYRNICPPTGLHNNSSEYCSPRSQGPNSANIQCFQGPRPINSNQNLRNFNVPQNTFMNVNRCDMPWAYGNHPFPRISRPQQPLHPPSLPPPSHNLPQQTISRSNRPQNERCLLICENNTLKKNDLNVVDPSKVNNGVQVTKEGTSTFPVNHFKIPASIVLETLEPVETQIKMLEELDKITIEEEFEILFKKENENNTISPENVKVLTTKPEDNPHRMKIKTDDQEATRNGIQEHLTNGINVIQQAATKNANGIQQLAPDKIIGVQQATTNSTNEIERPETSKINGVQQVTTNTTNGIQQPAANKINGMQQATTNKTNGVQPVANKINGMEQATSNKTNGIQQPTMNKINGLQRSTTNKKSEIQQPITNKTNKIQQPATNKTNRIQQPALNKTTGFQQATKNKIYGFKNAKRIRKRKMQQALWSKNQILSSTGPLKGYSPPILPIPGTLEEILEKVQSEPKGYSETNKSLVGIDLSTTETDKRRDETNNRRAEIDTRCVKICALKDLRLVNNDIQPKTSTKKANKISLDEYKKRIGQSYGNYYAPSKKMRGDRNHSVDSDLGYDSDSTIIISDGVR